MGKSMPCTKLDSDTIGSVPGCHGCALAAGAAVAFGLMGMAEAIRKSASYVPTCSTHGLPFDSYIGGGMMMCRGCYVATTQRHGEER